MCQGKYRYTSGNLLQDKHMYDIVPSWLNSDSLLHLRFKPQIQARLQTFCCDCIVSCRRASFQGCMLKMKKCTTKIPH